jgi:hypothetical protein
MISGAAESAWFQQPDRSGRERDFNILAPGQVVSQPGNRGGLGEYPKTRSSRAWLVLIAGLALSLRWPATAATGYWLVLSFALRAILRLKLGLAGVPGWLLAASPIAGRGLNFQLVEFVPLGIRTITVRYCE